MKSRQISGLPDVARLQRVQDEFADITEMAIVFLTPTARQVTQTSHCSKLFRTLSSTPQGAALCNEAVSQLCRQTALAGVVSTATCPHTGLLLAGIPLMSDDECLGVWITGQVRVGQHLDYYERYALQLDYEIDISSHTLRMLVCELPELSMETFRCNIGLLQQMGERLLRLPPGSRLPPPTGRYTGQQAGALQRFTSYVARLFM